MEPSKEKGRFSEQTSKGEITRFSTASTTPSFVLSPMAVEPSCHQNPNPFITRTKIQQPSGFEIPKRTKKEGKKRGTGREEKSDLDGLDGVLHLEQPPLGGEGIDASIVLGPSIKNPNE